MNDAPREIRRFACQIWRVVSDWTTGRQFKMVASNNHFPGEGADFPVRFSIQQRVLPTEYVQAKLHNIETACRSLSDLPVPSGGIFSFWRVVGRPSKNRGFLPGRSLLGGQLQPDYGGGLCQLSGLLYQLSLQARLEIPERHPHSRDIYIDAERYAPLGADATVAYGFKDLRVLNTLTAPICFRISVAAQIITGHLCSPDVIIPSAVEFRETAQTDGVFTTVETRRQNPGDSELQTIAVSRYRRISTTSDVQE